MQGAAGEHCSQRPTKTRQCSCENVPAIFQFFVNGNRLSQVPACRLNLHFFPALLSQSGIYFEIYLHQNLPQIFAETISPTVLWLFDIFSPRSCRRRTLGLFGNNRRNIIWDFQHAGQNSMDSGFNYVWQYWMLYIVFEKYLMWLLY